MRALLCESPPLPRASSRYVNCGPLRPFKSAAFDATGRQAGFVLATTRDITLIDDIKQVLSGHSLYERVVLSIISFLFRAQHKIIAQPRRKIPF